MSEFEKCPITGEIPEWSGSDCRLAFKLPFMSCDYVSRYCGARNMAFRWWHNEYIPAARKLAEQQEPEWEPQVGDVVGPSLKFYETVIGHTLNRERLHKTATIIEVFPEDDKYKLDRPILNSGFTLSGEFLRLISRPKKLTVADLPDGWEIRETTPGVWYSPKSDLLDDMDNAWPSEHEAVKAALDFCRKIADGMKKLEGV